MIDSRTLITVRAGDVAEQLAQRVADKSDVALRARDDLGRYYALLDDSLILLGNVLTVADVSTLMRVHGGGSFERPLHLWASVSDDAARAARDAARFLEIAQPVDETLAPRVAALPLAAQYALLDALDRAWLVSDWQGALGFWLRRE